MNQTTPNVKKLISSPIGTSTPTAPIALSKKNISVFKFLTNAPMVKNFVSQTQQVWDYIFCESLLSAPVRKNVLKTDAFFILVLCSTKTNICRASHCRVTAEEKKT